MVSVALSALSLSVLIVEILLKVFGNVWLRREWAALPAIVHAFRSATNDEDRQRLVMQAGWRTLRLSCLAAIVVLVVLSLAALPPYVWRWSDVDLGVYSALLTILSLAWWWLRAKHRRSRQ